MELEKDILSIAKDVEKTGFSNSSILVTGSTGLIGSLIVKGFAEANKRYKLNNKIYALARNVNKANNVFGDYLKDQNLCIVQNEITQNVNINENVDYIFHCACVTTSKDMVTYPVELIKTSVGGTINILDFAKSHNVKSVVYLSSMEVFGVSGEYSGRLKENDLGKLDLSLVRSCYPESKRLCENTCKCYAEEYGLNVCVARLTQTFGAGASLEDNRIFAMLAKCVVNKDDIVLKTDGKSTKDYCYTTDAISALLILAKKGKSGEVYNVANDKSTISILEMAKLVASSFKNKVNVVVKAETGKEIALFSPPSVTKLDTSKLKQLGWKAKVDLPEMYGKLINHYDECMKEGKKGGMIK